MASSFQGRVAIFDYDRTLVSNYTFPVLCELLQKRKLIKTDFLSDYKTLQKAIIKDKVSYNDSLVMEKEVFAKHMKGLSSLELQRFIREEYEPSQYFRPWAHDVFNLLRENGFLIVVVSATLQEFLEVVQETIDFDSYFATRFEQEQGIYTGKIIEVVNASAKANHIKQLLRNVNYSIAFGDSIGDFEMLDLVSTPFLYTYGDKVAIEALGQRKYNIVDDKTILPLVKGLISELAKK